MVKVKKKFRVMEKFLFVKFLNTIGLFRAVFVVLHKSNAVHLRNKRGNARISIFG